MKSIPASQFTENTLSLRWQFPLESSSITAWNLLIIMAASRSRQFPTRQEAARACGQAYGMECGYRISAMGQSLQIEMRAKWLREDLISEPEYSDLVCRIFDQFLNHPLLDEASFEESRYLLETRLKAIHQDPDSRASRLAFEAASPDTLFSLPLYGRLEDLEECTLEDVRKLFCILQETRPSVYFAGNEAGKLYEFARKLDDQNFTPEWNLLEAPLRASVRTEERDLSQSACVQIYASGISIFSEQSDALLVLNSLLGSASVSLLFEKIREQNSLCYSIYSYVIRFDGALVICFDTDRDQMDQARGLIREILDATARGDFSDEKLNLVKREMIDSLLGQQDSPMSMILQEQLDTMLERHQTQEERIARIESVTRDQIMKAARCLKLAGEGLMLQKKEAEEWN